VQVVSLRREVPRYLRVLCPPAIAATVANVAVAAATLAAAADALAAATGSFAATMQRHGPSVLPGAAAHEL